LIDFAADNPYALEINPSSPVLLTLQSAIPASEKLIVDFNSAYVAGEEK